VKESADGQRRLNSDGGVDSWCARCAHGGSVPLGADYVAHPELQGTALF